MRVKIAIILILLAAVSHAQSLDSLLTAIEHNNLQLRSLAKDHEAEILDLKADNLPEGLSVEYSPFLKSGQTNLVESELIVSQQIDFPTKYAMRSRLAEKRQTALQSLYLSQRSQILLDARLLIIDIIRLNQMVDMHQKRLSDSQWVLNLIEKRIEAGDATALELNKARLEKMDVQKLLVSAQGERSELLQQLQQLNGGIPLAVELRTFPDTPLQSDFESFLQDVLRRNPDILTADAQLSAVAQELRMARQEWLPGIKLGYRRNTEAELPSHHGMLLGLTFPVSSSSSRIKAARRRQESSQLQLQQARNQVETELRTLHAQYLSLQSVLEHEDVTMMQQTLQLLAKALQYGEITALQYYTEIASIYEKLQSHIDTHCKSCRVYARLHKD